MKQKQKANLCSKIVFKVEGSESPSVLYGLIISNKSNFVSFKTDKKDYTISKNCILSIESTEIPFRENQGSDYNE